METVPLRPLSLDAVVRAAEKVRERVLRATGGLEQAGIPYAVVGGNAAAAWVSRVDGRAVCNTPDVDILLRRTDIERATTALSAIGFVRQNVGDVVVFRNDPQASPRDVVHIVFAGEKVRPEYLLPAPDVAESETTPDYRVLQLEPLVGMMLNANRTIDKMYLRDLLDIGLIDATWVGHFSPELASRLQHLVDTPGG